MKKPLISILVPVYNVEAYIDECLDSLAGQTYTNLEIILVDDGSTDSSLQYCQDWAERDTRFQVFHIENHGVSYARNYALSKCTGDYIGFVDPDDWIDKDMYEIMMQNMLQYNSDIHGTGFVTEHDNGPKISLRQASARQMTQNEALHEIFGFNGQKPILIWSLCDKLIRRQLIGDLRLDEGLKLSEDQWFLWQLVRRANLISYTPSLSYHYRMRDGSATHSAMTPETGTYLDAMKRILRDATTLDEELQKDLKRQYDIILINVLKHIIVSDSLSMKSVYDAEHLHLLKSLPSLLLSSRTSLRQKLGVIYLSLPFSVAYRLKSLIS